MKPTPFLHSGKWVVSLRWAGFGQRYPLCDGALPEIEAVHQSYQLLGRLRAERVAEPTPQLALNLSGGRSFADAAAAWLAEKDHATGGGEAWTRQYAAHVAAELGAYQLAEFLPPEGSRRLRAYREGMTKAGRAPNTVANRLSIAGQVLEYAAEQGWIALVPRMPSRPPRRPPQYLWQTEAQFRLIRDKVFTGRAARGSRAHAAMTDDEWTVYVARRRCYLSWLFYTGAHTADADHCTSDFISLDMGVFRRRNSKSASSVPDETFELPEPLVDDLRALQDLLGRPFYIDEPVFAGVWANVASVIGKASRRLKFGLCNPRILRRSCIRELCLRGYTEQEVADRMGHVDTRMIHEVYLRTPRPLGSARSLWKRLPPVIRAPGQVVRFPGTQAAKLSSVSVGGSPSLLPEQT